MQRSGIEEIKKKDIKVVIARGIHLFPFRTEKLSPVTPMVLRNSGRVGSRRFGERKPVQRNAGSAFGVLRGLGVSGKFMWIRRVKVVPLSGQRKIYVDKTSKSCTFVA